MAHGDTKERLLGRGAGLVREQGLKATGIQQVLKAARVPKGSFYHYFGSKEEFGIALAERFGEEFTSRLEEFLGDLEHAPLLRLARFFGYYHAMFEDRGFIESTPLGMLALDVSSEGTAFRRRLESAFSKAEVIVGGCIREAQERGEVSAGLDPDEAAVFILSAWEGAVMRMRASGGPAPLRAFETLVFGSILV